jgi:hypothetical protein
MQSDILSLNDLLGAFYDLDHLQHRMIKKAVLTVLYYKSKGAVIR